MVSTGDDPLAVAQALGLGTMRFAETLDDLQPDLVVVLGDRYEALALAQAAMILKVPIAHIHGGEATEGLIDEAVRHSISKMAQFHFTAAEPYRRRVIQLGEHPDRVFNIGAPGLDNLTKLDLLSQPELASRLAIPPNEDFLLVTFHPVTLDESTPEAALNELLAALDTFPDHRVVITKSNADPYGQSINGIFDDYAAHNADRAHAYSSLGQATYLSAMCEAAAVVGNSSSGIVEAPSAGTPTVNIGDRQRGRLRAPSVIDCEARCEAIVVAITHALSTEHQALAARCETPYGEDGASARIVARLKELPLEGILMKSFYEPAEAV